MRTAHPILFSLALLCAPHVTANEQDDALETGWRHLSQMKNTEALSQFSALASRTGPQREARLGKILAQLSAASERLSQYHPDDTRLANKLRDQLDTQNEIEVTATTPVCGSAAPPQSRSN